MLDVYAPARAVGRLPVIVFFYGGSWQSGERAEYAFIATVLARRGFVVVVPDYRVFPQVRYPDFLHDCAAAVGWVFERIAGYGGDPAQVFLLGHSAGAYNAVMLALVPGLLAQARLLAGVIGLAGPYDFLPLRDGALQTIFANPAGYEDTQPITHATGEAAPMLLLTGGRDRTVLPRNTAVLAARLRQLGGTVETKIYPKLGHIGIILAALPYFGWRAPVLADIIGFCEACRAGAYAPAHSATAAPMLG